MKLETVPCDTLSFDPANLRKHGKKNLDAIKASLRRFGQQKPIVVDAKGIVLAGNGTLAAAQELGWKEIQIVRTDLAGTQATAFGIADNRSAELAEWDEKLGDVLASLKAEDFPLEEIGFDAADLEELAPEAAGSDVDAEPQIDKAEELRAKWGVELGQVWQLGEHRIACGDSTKIEEVKKLMASDVADAVITDPPYGIDYQSNYRKQKFDRLKNDDIVMDEWIEPCAKFSSGWFIFFCAWQRLDEWIAVGRKVGDLTNLLIWKKAAAMGDLAGSFSPTFEVALAYNRGAKLVGGVRPSAVFEHAIESAAGFYHPTTKPVSLIAELIINVSEIIVLDPFSGSGTTIIACERTGRKCRAIELNPGYVAIAIQRWADATGKEPKKL
jgi:DNA modification methylase